MSTTVTIELVAETCCKCGVIFGLTSSVQEQLKRDGELFYCTNGHPTKAQLLLGTGKRGHPVSKYNVWCDKECGRLAEQYLKLLEYKNDK